MFTLTIAFLLDLLIGDPVYSFHPVRVMGKVIDRAETFLRSKVRREKLAGGILAVSFPAAVFLVVWLLIFFLEKINFWFGWAANLYGIYASLSIRDLRKEGIHIYQDLVKGDIQKARTDLARIVGRDTQELDEKNIIRAAVETTAESTVDGMIAPLFYAAIGGAPLALVYKAVNTLDSMMGHLNDRYRDFGFVAAKQDELWNWIPARISYYVIALASFFFNRRVKEASFAGWQDGMSTSYGNSAIPEATFAGAMGLKLGGPSTYQGRLVEKPFLGFRKKDFEREDLMTSLNLMMVASWISLFGALLLKHGLGLLCRTI